MLHADNKLNDNFSAAAMVEGSKGCRMIAAAGDVSVPGLAGETIIQPRDENVSFPLAFLFRVLYNMVRTASGRGSN